MAEVLCGERQQQSFVRRVTHVSEHCLWQMMPQSAQMRACFLIVSKHSLHSMAARRSSAVSMDAHTRDRPTFAEAAFYKGVHHL